MSRSNKTTAGAFTTINGNRAEKSAVNVFIEHGKNLNKSDKLSSIETQYINLINKTNKTIQKLANLETVIMQLRAKENLPEVKLSRVKNHIYARTVFYRPETSANDIRVIVGKTDVWGENLSSLMNDKKFMKIAKTKLIEAMEVDINTNLTKR